MKYQEHSATYKTITELVIKLLSLIKLNLFLSKN